MIVLIWSPGKNGCEAWLPPSQDTYLAFASAFRTAEFDTGAMIWRIDGPDAAKRVGLWAEEHGRDLSRPYSAVSPERHGPFAKGVVLELIQSQGSRPAHSRAPLSWCARLPADPLINDLFRREFPVARYRPGPYAAWFVHGAGARDRLLHWMSNNAGEVMDAATRAGIQRPLALDGGGPGGTADRLLHSLDYADATEGDRQRGPREAPCPSAPDIIEALYKIDGSVTEDEAQSWFPPLGRQDRPAKGSPGLTSGFDKHRLPRQHLSITPHDRLPTQSHGDVAHSWKDMDEELATLPPSPSDDASCLTLPLPCDDVDGVGSFIELGETLYRVTGCWHTHIVDQVLALLHPHLRKHLGEVAIFTDLRKATGVEHKNHYRNKAVAEDLQARLASSLRDQTSAIETFNQVAVMPPCVHEMPCGEIVHSEQKHLLPIGGGIRWIHQAGVGLWRVEGIPAGKSHDRLPNCPGGLASVVTGRLGDELASRLRQCAEAIKQGVADIRRLSRRDKNTPPD